MFVSDRRPSLVRVPTDVDGVAVSAMLLERVLDQLASIQCEGLGVSESMY